MLFMKYLSSYKVKQLNSIGLAFDVLIIISNIYCENPQFYKGKSEILKKFENSKLPQVSKFGEILAPN